MRALGSRVEALAEQELNTSMASLAARFADACAHYNGARGAARGRPRQGGAREAGPPPPRVIPLPDGRRRSDLRAPRSSPPLSLWAGGYARSCVAMVAAAMTGRVHGAGMREQQRAVAAASCSSSSDAAGRVEEQGLRGSTRMTGHVL